jgi:hypothetical protein
MLGPTAVIVPTTGKTGQDFMISQAWKKPASSIQPNPLAGVTTQWLSTSAAEAPANPIDQSPRKLYHVMDRRARDADGFPSINGFHEGFHNSCPLRARTQYLVAQLRNLKSGMPQQVMTILQSANDNFASNDSVKHPESSAWGGIGFSAELSRGRVCLACSPEPPRSHHLLL